MLVRFLLDTGAKVVSVTPKTDQIELSKDRQRGEAFLRSKMEGNLLFTRGDYDLINDRPRTQKFRIALQRRLTVADNWTTESVSSFYKSDCEFDPDNKIVKIQDYEPEDKFKALLDKGDEEKDIIELGVQPHEVTYYKYGVFQVYEKNSTTINNITKGHYWESAVTSPSDDHDELVNDFKFGYNETHQRRLFASGGSVPTVPNVSGYWTGNFGNLITDTITNGSYSLYRVGDRAGQYDDPNTPGTGTIGFSELRMEAGTDFDDWDDFESVWSVGGTNIEFIGTWFDGVFDRAVFRTFGVAIPSSGTLTHVSGATNTADKNYTAEIRSDIVPSGIEFERWGIKEGSTIHFAGESKFYFSDRYVEVGGLYKSTANSTQLRIYEKEFYVRYLSDNGTVNGESGITYPTEDLISGVDFNFVYPIELTSSLFTLTDSFGGVGFGKFPGNAENNAGENFIHPAANVVPIARKDWVGASIWLTYDGFFNNTLDNDKELITLRHAYKLKDIINVLIQDIDSDLTFDTSQFFLDSVNPITGELNQEYYLTPKSNIINFSYSREATKFPLSLNDVWLAIWNMWRCKWTIEDNSVVIEHDRYFRNGGNYNSPQIGLNFQTILNPKNGFKKTYGQNQHKADKQNMPYLIEFGWSDEVSQLFEGKSIEIIDDFVDESLKEDRSTPKFVTDLMFLLTQSESVSIEGVFVLGSYTNNGVNYIPFKAINVNGFEWNTQNAALSNYYLVDKFHRDNLPATNVKINEVTTTATSVKRSTIQNMTIPLSTIDNKKLILRDIGLGEVDEFKVDVFNNRAKVKTRHDLQ